MKREDGFVQGMSNGEVHCFPTTQSVYVTGNNRYVLAAYSTCIVRFDRRCPMGKAFSHNLLLLLLFASSPTGFDRPYILHRRQTVIVSQSWPWWSYLGIFVWNSWLVDRIWPLWCHRMTISTFVEALVRIGIVKMYIPFCRLQYNEHCIEWLQWQTISMMIVVNSMTFPNRVGIFGPSCSLYLLNTSNIVVPQQQQLQQRPRKKVVSKIACGSKHIVIVYGMSFLYSTTFTFSIHKHLISVWIKQFTHPYTHSLWPSITAWKNRWCRIVGRNWRFEKQVHRSQVQGARRSSRRYTPTQYNTTGDSLVLWRLLLRSGLGASIRVYGRSQQLWSMLSDSLLFELIQDDENHVQSQLVEQLICGPAHMTILTRHKRLYFVGSNLEGRMYIWFKDWINLTINSRWFTYWFNMTKCLHYIHCAHLAKSVEWHWVIICWIRCTKLCSIIQSVTFLEMHASMVWAFVWCDNRVWRVGAERAASLEHQWFVE